MLIIVKLVRESANSQEKARVGLNLRAIALLAPEWQ
jgi:hypothetical protein